MAKKTDMVRVKVFFRIPGNKPHEPVELKLPDGALKRALSGQEDELNRIANQLNLALAEEHYDGPKVEASDLLDFHHV